MDSPIHFRAEQNGNPRMIERSQILRLMNLIAEVIYIGKFDAEVGTDKIESRLQKGEKFKLDHLRAFRLSKEEIVYNWLQYVEQVARTYFITLGNPDPQKRLFQTPFPEQVWVNIGKFLENLRLMPLWVNSELSETVFGGKQTNNFWKAVFETGHTPQGMAVLVQPSNLIEMIK